MEQDQSKEDITEWNEPG